MKRRIFSLILASALMFSFVPLVFAATLLTSVSVSVNIMEETGIKRANENLVVWAYSETNSYGNSGSSPQINLYDTHWYETFANPEDGKNASDYEYDEVNNLYLKEMTENDVFSKEKNYAFKTTLRLMSTGLQFGIQSNEDITVNNYPLNNELTGGKYSVEDYKISSDYTVPSYVCKIYSLLPSSFVQDRIYDVKLYGTEITKNNKNDIFGDGTASYVPATETECAKLHLNNFVKTTTTNTLSLINVNEDLEIIVSGTNKLSCSASARGNAHTDGIYSTGKLTVKGNGSLTLNPMYSFSGWSSGIYCTENITVCEDVQLKLTTNEGSTYTYGIHSGGDLTIKDNATVSITNAGYATNAKNARAINAINVNILDNTTVFAENRGHKDGLKYGVYASKKLTFTGNKLTTNVGADTSSRAIYAVTYDLGNSACFGASSISDVSYGGTSITSNNFNSSTYRAIRIEKAYKTSVNGTPILVSTKDDVLKDGTVKYTPEHGNMPATLTLDGANISKIKATEDLIIDVISESSVNVGTSTSDNAIDINGRGYIKGDGYLTVKGGKNSGYGIKTTGYLNFGIELTIDAKQAIYSPDYTPKNSDDVYVNTVYGDADNAYDWDRETPITTYSHVYIYASAPSLYVNGVLVTDENKNAYYETEHWYAKTYGINSNDVVLYLEGVSFDTDSNVRSDSSTIWCDGDLTIELKGENSIVSPGNPSANFVAPVNCYGNLTINGNSQNEDILNISSTLSSAPVFMNSYAIQVSDELTLNNCKVTAYAPNCNSSRSYGVYAVNALNVNHSYIEGLARKHTYAENEASVGIYAGSLTINGNDCTVSGRSTASDSGYGILVPYQFDDLELTGGNFAAIGNTAAYDISGYELNIGNYIEPIIYAKKSTGDSVKIWDGSYPLSESKYLSISQGKYNVYVGGVEVTAFNASDIFGDETAVLTFDENKLPVLTLTNANITGFSKTQSPLYYACIWSEKPLTVIFNGNCTVDSGEGEINSVAEKRRYAIYNRDDNITIIANENSVTNISGYSSIYSGGNINISLFKNAKFNVNGLTNSGSCIYGNNFSLCGDGGYTFNVLNPGTGSCISVSQTGTTSFTSDSTEVFSNINLKHNCTNGSENYAPILSTMKRIQVKNVYMNIRGFCPTTMVIPQFSTEPDSNATDNLLITVAEDENAYFSYKWDNSPLITDDCCRNFVKIEPYYDSYGLGDTNGDEIINGNDYAELVNKVLSCKTEFEHKTAYDMNRDTAVDVLDCVLLERTVNNL